MILAAIGLICAAFVSENFVLVTRLVCGSGRVGKAQVLLYISVRVTIDQIVHYRIVMFESGAKLRRTPPRLQACLGFLTRRSSQGW